MSSDMYKISFYLFHCKTLHSRFPTTKEGIFIKMWESINLAEKTLNIKNISTCCQNKRKTSGGYIWKYKED